MCQFDAIYNVVAIVLIIIIITCYLSTPCFKCEQFTKVQAVSYLRASPHPSHLTRPHPHAVMCKVIIISEFGLVPY